MSERENAEWETKAKDALLRRDSRLNNSSSAMKTIMSSGVEVNGTKMYLSNFGINTLGYFSSQDNEKAAYYIDGDSDSAEVSNNTDVLRNMIATEPDTVVEFFTGLSRNLYSKVGDLMKSTENSSAYTVYDDKKMKTDYDNYKTKIEELEKQLQAYEDKWYSKFSAMETALAKLQSNASEVTSLLGGC